MKNKTCGECKFFVQSEYLDVCTVHSEYKSHNSKCDLCEYFKPKVITNGDKIRQMSNEELADYMSDTDVHACMKDDTRHCNEDWDCHKCWLEWLESEVEDEQDL